MVFSREKDTGNGCTRQGKTSELRNTLLLTWIIHESRLLQMRGAVHEAVVYHREWAATKQMW